MQSDWILSALFKLLVLKAVGLIELDSLCEVTIDSLIPPSSAAIILSWAAMLSPTGM